MGLTVEEHERLKMLAAQDAIHNGAQEQQALAQLTREYESAKKKGKIEQFEKVVRKNLF